MPRKKQSEQNKPEKKQLSQKQTKQNTSHSKNPAKPSQNLNEEKFPIVGIGASAGGLEAMEQLFKNMPDNTGMAFIIVTHQETGHHSMLADLLQKYTNMRVMRAEDQMAVEPNCVYVTIPGNDLGLLNRTIHLLKSVTDGPKAPINYLFRSLAQDQSEFAIAILLSGMGSDGTFGIKDIKGELGMVMVQNPDSAKYTGMIDSAIETGLVDYILPPDQMPKQLVQYANQIVKRKKVKVDRNVQLSGYMQKIFMLLRSYTGHDFSAYKRNTIVRRVERRMNVHHIEDISDYIRLLQKNGEEAQNLFKELLIGVTSFFRDPDAFAALKQKALPTILNQKNDDNPIRIWVPGCSSGEEVYSIAIVVKEYMEEHNSHYNIQIFGTDISDSSIHFARHGVYPGSIENDVGSSRLERYFIKQDQSYQIQGSIREMIIFAPHNIIKDPPFTRLDMICCRNVLIYLDSDLQKKLIPLFHYAMKPEGVLFLGSSESIGDFRDLFEALDTKEKIYKRRDSAVAMQRLPDFRFTSKIDPDAEKPSARPSREENLPQQIEKLLADIYAPSSVVINKNGEIVYVHGRTGKFLEPPQGQANWNIFEMAREGLKLRLPAAVRKAVSSNTEVINENLKVKMDDTEVYITLVISPIMKPNSMKDFLVVSFKDVRSVKEKESSKTELIVPEGQSSRVDELEKELQYTKENLQTAIEELETSNEELKSINEAYQSTNEELQSTNEELETSREEMQSLNEELQTVNAELQQKIDEVQRAYNSMKSFIDNLDIPTVLLDNNMHVRQFSSDITKIIKLIPADIGRSIVDIVNNLKEVDLFEQAHKVQKSARYTELEVQTKNGYWYLMRILPFRTMGDQLEGVIISFLDINELKQLKEQLKKTEITFKYAESIVETVREPLVVLDGNLKVISANRSFYHTFQLPTDSTVGEYIYKLGDGEWNIPDLIKMLKNVIPNQEVFNDFLMEHKINKIGYRKMLLNARRIYEQDAYQERILLAIEDITDKGI